MSQRTRAPAGTLRGRLGGGVPILRNILLSTVLDLSEDDLNGDEPTGDMEADSVP
jgi:hypothetical protein